MKWSEETGLGLLVHVPWICLGVLTAELWEQGGWDGFVFSSWRGGKRLRLAGLPVMDNALVDVILVLWCTLSGETTYSRVCI